MLFTVIYTLLIVQRLAELYLAERNTRQLLAMGAHEVGRKHYGWLVALHALYFICLPLEVQLRGSQLSQAWLFFFGLFVLAQLGRLWVIRTLGSRWTTRIIVLPGVPLVRSGPYRWLKHPNYWIVSLEFFAVPMMFGALWTALVMSMANALLLLFVRIPAEDRALGRTQA